MYCYSLLLHHLLFRRYEEHVVGFQSEVGYGTLHNSVDVDGNHLQRAVFLHAVHHGMCCECLLSYAFTTLEQLAHGGDVAAHLIHARTEYGTLHFYHVSEAGQNGVNAYRVFVCKMERTHVELVNIINRELATSLTYQSY